MNFMMRQLGIALFVVTLSSFCVCPVESMGQITVEFGDGSRVSARDLMLTADSCKLFDLESILTSEGKKEMYTMERDKPVSIVLQKSAMSDQWDKLRDSTAEFDRIVIDREGHLDFYSGTVSEISAEKVFFRRDSSGPTSKTFELNRSKIVGVILASKSGSLPATSVKNAHRAGRAGEILRLANGDVLYSVLDSAPETQGRLPWILANGLSGQVKADQIKSRLDNKSNAISLLDIEPTEVLALPSGQTVPAITANQPDWKNTGVYRKLTSTQAVLVPPCLVVWPIPPNVVRVEGEFRFANVFQAGTPFPELKISIRTGENGVFRQSLDVRQRQVPFSLPLGDGTKLECRVEFEGIPMPGGLVVFSGNFITASPRK